MAQVVKVVLVVDPTVAVAAQLQALSLVLHHLGVRALAVEKDTFEQLKKRGKSGTILFAETQKVVKWQLHSYIPCDLTGFFHKCLSIAREIKSEK